MPWQSVHDGERHAHDPLRLSVCVEALHEAMSEILGRHASVRALFDNGWLHLLALDDAGRIAWRYAGDLTWSAMGERDSVAFEPRPCGDDPCQGRTGAASSGA